MTRILTLALAALLLPSLSLAATPAQLCESAKLGAASKFSACRLKADSVYAKSARTVTDEAKRDAAYAKCDAALVKAYGLAEGKYGSACPAEWTVDAVAGQLTACSVLPTPTPTPTPIPTPTPTPTPCAVVSNGKGGTYTDNCNGTVTDSTTGLVWEKKTDDGGIHDQDNTYSWSTGSPWDFDGTAVSVFLATLNTTPCFAGSCNWRLPTIIELSGRNDEGYATGGIVDVTVPGCQSGPPCINPIFGPTRSAGFWSSSTDPDFPDGARSMNFTLAGVFSNSKTSGFYVRAVRGGS